MRSRVYISPYEGFKEVGFRGADSLVVSPYERFKEVGFSVLTVWGTLLDMLLDSQISSDLVLVVALARLISIRLEALCEVYSILRSPHTSF